MVSPPQLRLCKKPPKEVSTQQLAPGYFRQCKEPGGNPQFPESTEGCSGERRYISGDPKIP
jgi:hypothetical protein